mmetsp:Transcript_5848/g.11057  ORF Transcript_5848/g.11057 Transcript_5848/m.11057 type:complete len:130 (-) Transcript_5848:1391-1780(-)
MFLIEFVRCSFWWRLEVGTRSGVRPGRDGICPGNLVRAVPDTSKNSKNSRKYCCSCCQITVECKSSQDFIRNHHLLEGNEVCFQTGLAHCPNPDCEKVFLSRTDMEKHCTMKGIKNTCMPSILQENHSH